MQVGLHLNNNQVVHPSLIRGSTPLSMDHSIQMHHQDRVNMIRDMVARIRMVGDIHLSNRLVLDSSFLGPKLVHPLFKRL